MIIEDTFLWTKVNKPIAKISSFKKVHQPNTTLLRGIVAPNQDKPRFSPLNQAAANYVALQSPPIKATKAAKPKSKHKLLLFFMLDLVMENYKVTTNYIIETLQTNMWQEYN